VASPVKKPPGRPYTVASFASLGIKYKPYKEDPPKPLREKRKVPSPIK